MSIDYVVFLGLELGIEYVPDLQAVFIGFACFRFIIFFGGNHAEHSAL